MEVVQFVALLVVLLAPVFVDASCGRCYDDRHACISETQFYLCEDGKFMRIYQLILIDLINNSLLGVPDTSFAFTCPSDTPICADLGDICFGDSPSITRGCGDTAKCGLCSEGEVFACTSRTSFGLCRDGVVSSDNMNCTSGNICSAEAAASGIDPCVSRCSVDESDICDLELDADDSIVTTPNPTESSISTDTSSSTTTPEGSTGTASTTPESTGTSPSGSTETSGSPGSTESSSPTTVTTVAPTTPSDFNEQTYCQGFGSVGLYPIPNDTACTSYIYCVFRSGSWSGLLYNCPPNKPYFNANEFKCGTVQPTSAGCIN
ncbi:hypothetical protein KR009_009132 [Drosophila setifemur]|nr:hypothetical protein KR009_009132 [Drosophila setifemur]